MMNSFRERFAKYMVGRYGPDRLGQFFIGAALFFLVSGIIFRNIFVDWAAIICMIVCYFRMFSKNISKRYEENQKYERMRFKVTERFRKWKYKWKQAREYHIYKCPKCSQKIRVPRGKGRISIHCPKCNTDFIKKS